MRLLNLLRSPKKNKVVRAYKTPVAKPSDTSGLQHRAEFYLHGVVGVLNRLDIPCSVSRGASKITPRYVAIAVRLNDPTLIGKATETNTLRAMAHGAGVQHVLLEQHEGVLYYLFPVPDAASPTWRDPDVDRQTVGVSALGTPVRLTEKMWEKGHLLVSGMTGSGKSCLLDTIMFSLTQTYTSDQAGFIIIDPAGDHYHWEQTAYVLGPTATERHEIAAALTFAAAEAHRRVTSREWITNKQGLKKWFIIIDEADGTEAFPSDMKELVTEVGRTLAVDGRKAQVHMIFGTHRPTATELKPVVEVCATKFLGQAFDARTSGQYGGGLHLDWLRGAGDFIYKEGEQTTRFQAIRTEGRTIKGGVPKRSGVLKPFPVPKGLKFSPANTEVLELRVQVDKLRRSLHAIDPKVLSIVLMQTTDETDPDKLVIDLGISKEVAKINLQLARAVEIHFRELQETRDA